MTKRACKICKRILKTSMCPACKTNETTTSFQGVVVIFDIQSEIAKRLNIETPGRYAVRV